VWEPKRALPEIRRRVANVLLAIHKREPARGAPEGIRPAVWEPNTRLPDVRKRVARVLAAVMEQGANTSD